VNLLSTITLLVIYRFRFIRGKVTQWLHFINRRWNLRKRAICTLTPSHAGTLCRWHGISYITIRITLILCHRAFWVEFSLGVSTSIAMLPAA